MKPERRCTILITLLALFLMVYIVPIVSGQQNKLPKEATPSWPDRAKKEISNSKTNWVGISNQSYDKYGHSVGTAGDVNGDGYSDIIVGAPYYDNGERYEGRTYVYYGSISGLSTTPDWTGESNQKHAHYGWSVGTAGDVNGDGYSDIIIGAPYYDNDEDREGRAYVYYGSASGLSTTPDWTGESNQKRANYGDSVGTAGDVNGDGYSDIVIGVPFYNNDEEGEGRAYVYYGSASGLSTTPGWIGESNQSYSYYGNSVGTAGDVNGDGYSDIVVGAYFYTNKKKHEGRVYVYYGSASGLNTTPDWIGASNQSYSYYGNSVGTAGDVNDDGYSDIIVGAPSYNNNKKQGIAYVYYGSISGISATAGWAGESNQKYAYYGLSVGTAGDVNGDGYSDIIIGAYHSKYYSYSEGRAHLYHGSTSGSNTKEDWIGSSYYKYNSGYGHSVGTAGDVNGDGYSDIIIGIPYYYNGENNRGRTYVYHGIACETATLSSKFSLYIPQIVYTTTSGDLYIWAKLEYTTSYQNGNVSFKVVDYGNIDFNSKCDYATMRKDLELLSVPRIKYDSSSFWVDLEKIQSSGGINGTVFGVARYGSTPY